MREVWTAVIAEVVGPCSTTSLLSLCYRLPLLHLVCKSTWPVLSVILSACRIGAVHACNRRSATLQPPATLQQRTVHVVLHASTLPPRPYYIAATPPVQHYLHAERGSIFPRECDGERASRVDRRVRFVRSRCYRRRVEVEVIVIVISVHCTWATYFLH